MHHTNIAYIHAGLDESQAGIKISRRNINNPRYADNSTQMAASEDETLPNSFMSCQFFW